MRVESDRGSTGRTTRTTTNRVSPDQIARWHDEDRRLRASNTRTPPATPKPTPTPQEAVQAIHETPLPRTDDLNGLSGQVAAAIYRDRVQKFNDQRLEAAQKALEQLRPQRSDFKGLNPATADAEYNDALAQFNADPYVDELLRIEVEASTQRDTVPAYMRNPEPTVNVTGLSVPEMRGALAALGVKLPQNATPDQVAAGFELLASVPQSLMGAILNPGMQVRFTSPVAGVGTPGIIPVGASANLVVEGGVTLSDPRVGIGFEQTQRLDMSLELRGEVSGGTQTTTQRSLYVWGSRLERLVLGSDNIRELVNSSPLLRNAVRGLPVSLTASEYAGSRLSYQAVVTPEQAQRIDKGDLGGAPNPLDPLSMPAGTSVMLTGQSLRGSTFEVGYKLMRLGADHTQLDGLGFGVRRGEGQVVEVFMGPVSSVENALFLGVGKGNFNVGVTAGHTYESQQLSVARIDLSTEEGRAAYQAFITTGRVPDWNPPGVMRAGEQSVYNYEHELYAGINVGTFSVGIGGSNAEDSIVETKWQDGSVEQTGTFRLFDVTSQVSFPRDASGQPVEDATTWRIVVPNSHPALASYLHSAYNWGTEQRDYDGEQHVQYTFTSDELMALRGMAREYVRATTGEYGVERMEKYDRGEMVLSLTETLMVIATAKKPEEVFAAIERAPENAATDLLAIAGGLQRSVPGKIEFRDAGD